MHNYLFLGSHRLWLPSKINCREPKVVAPYQTHCEGATIIRVKYITDWEIFCKNWNIGIFFLPLTGSFDIFIGAPFLTTRLLVFLITFSQTVYPAFIGDFQLDVISYELFMFLIGGRFKILIFPFFNKSFCSELFLTDLEMDNSWEARNAAKFWLI